MRAMLLVFSAAERRVQGRVCRWPYAPSCRGLHSRITRHATWRDRSAAWVEALAVPPPSTPLSWERQVEVGGHAARIRPAIDKRERQNRERLGVDGVELPAEPDDVT